jgi:hypothetical protein
MLGVRFLIPAKLDRFPVGCVTVRVGPLLLARVQRLGIGQTFLRHETLERGLPVMVVMGPGVRLATVGRGLELASEGARPLLPGKVSLLGQFDGKRECLRLPGFCKHRPSLVAGQTWQRLEPLSVEPGIRRAQE